MSSSTLAPHALRPHTAAGGMLVLAIALAPASLLAQAAGADRASVQRQLAEAEAEARQDWTAALEAAKALNALAPGGRVVIIDFRPKPLEERPWGPPPEQKMSREEVDSAMAEAGLFPAQVHEFLSEQFFVEYRPR